MSISELFHGKRAAGWLGVLLAVALSGGGCSIRRLAVNKAADALTGGGTTFTTDDDPTLVRDALPFSLKLMESLLAETPEHTGLLLTLSSGFTQYSYAFVQQEADEREATDFAAAEVLRGRARRLYGRACRYGLRGLEAEHRGFTNALAGRPAEAVRVLNKADVPLVYWSAASWAALIALSKDDPGRLAELPQVEALLERARALDPGWAEGSIPTLLIVFEMARPGAPAGAAERARAHFEKAVALSRGLRAGPYLNLAEAVCIENQDVREFGRLLRLALAIDPDAHPESRLENLIMQHRARWLLSRTDDLFLTPASGDRP